MSNTIGTALGMVMARSALSQVVADRRRSRHYLLVAVGFACAGLALGGWALGPSTSSSNTWRARTAFNAPDAVPFRGTIDEFRVGPLAVMAGPVGDPSALRAALSLPERVVTIRGRGALVTEPQSWLAELDADGHVEVSVGQEWCAFTYSGRRRAFDLRLHEAHIFVETACRDSLDAPFEVRTSQSSAAVTITAHDVHGEWRVSAPLYLATGWVSFWPYADHLVPRRRAVEVGWIALLLFPAGLWIAPAGIGPLAIAALVTASTMVMFALTSVLGLSGVLLLHVTGVPIGLAAGALARRCWNWVLRRS